MSCRTWTGIVALCVAASALHCTSDAAVCPTSEGTTEEHCRDFCQAINNCGLLPSQLGAGVNSLEDCVERCAASEDSLRDNVLQCDRCERTLPSSERALVANWCEASTCRDLHNCLSSIVGPAGIGGPAKLSVRVAERSAAVEAGGGGGGGAASDSTCSPAVWSSHDAASVCEETTITSAQVIVQTSSQILHDRSTSCGSVVKRGGQFTFDGAGVVRTGLRLERAQPPVGTPNCLIIWGSEVVVTARREAFAEIQIPTCATATGGEPVEPGIADVPRDLDCLWKVLSAATEATGTTASGTSSGTSAGSGETSSGAGGAREAVEACVLPGCEVLAGCAEVTASSFDCTHCKAAAN